MLMLALCAAALCAASVAAAVASGSRAGLSPGRRALMQWGPIALAVIVARAAGSVEVAMGLLFGTSVATLSMGVGSLCTVAPVGPAPARWKRLWPFTLAAVLIVFVSGFNGLLTWKHGLALSIEGLVILSLWRDPTYQHDWAPGAAVPAEASGGPAVPVELAWLMAGVSLLLAGAGGYLAVRGAQAGTPVHVSAGAVAASFLSLALCSPTSQSGRHLAQHGASWIPMTACVGVVLLNLCVLLPAMALVPYASAWMEAVRQSRGLMVDWSAVTPQAMVFPLAAWRIDTVVLIVLAVLQLPVAVGKWNLGREEGFLLIAGYCAYLLAVAASGL
jgi:cation:H+ antiporter